MSVRTQSIILLYRIEIVCARFLPEVVLGSVRLRACPY